MLDREKQPSLGMTVYAKEKVPSVVKKANDSSSEASVAVEVTVLDANDNNPIFMPSNLYEFTAESDARVGDIIGQVGVTLLYMCSAICRGKAISSYDHCPFIWNRK